MNKANINRAKKYFEKSSELEYSSALEIQPRLASLVVIPCFDEDWATLSKTLDSLVTAMDQSESMQGCLIVFNSYEENLSAIQINKNTISAFLAWKEECGVSELFYYMNIVFQQSKKSGVGYARKVGMDAAANYFYNLENETGVIICLDADTTVEPNYFVEIEGEFTNRKLEAASIHYEHQLPDDPQYRKAIIDYELHLRYFIGMQRLYNLPFAFQTVGSAMACTVEAYVRVGGMVKRQAGEDFYFMQKFAKEGSLKEINATTVFPSARVSHRVPFGTGRTIQQIEDKAFKQLETYHPDSFKDLEILETYLAAKFDGVEWNKSNTLIEWLERAGINEILPQMLIQSKGQTDFRRRFFQWFNAFSLMKYLHSLHEQEFMKVVIQEAIQSYFELIKLVYSDSYEENLVLLRIFDKVNAMQPE